MRFSCNYDYYPQPYEPNFFLREMTVDVLCVSENDEEVTAARMAIDHLDIDRALDNRQDIYEICDADSSGWESVFEALFEPGTQAEWREDFKFDELISHILFMHRSVFHPVLFAWQSFIFDHVANLTGHAAAFVMWKGETDLTDSQLSDLGFRIIAGTDLRLRPNMLLNNYSASHESRDVLDLQIPSDAQEYVDVNWKKQNEP